MSILEKLCAIADAVAPKPAIQIIPVDGCIDIDGDPANAVQVTRVTTVTDGVPVTEFYTDYGTATEALYTGDATNFVDCDTLEPIPPEPEVPICKDWEILDAYLPLGTRGVNVERWNGADALPSTGTTSVPSDYFTGGVDYSGMPAHPNAFTSTVCETDLLVLDQVNDPSQLRYWTYLYTTVPIRLREFHGRAESVEYYLGECCAPPVLNSTGVYPNAAAQGATFDVSLPAGVHYIGGLIHDHSFYSSVNYQYSVDNGETWTRVPAAWLYKSKPQISKCPVKYCPETQIFADAVTGEKLGTEVSLCQPDLCSPVIIASPDGPQCELIELFEIIKEPGTVEQKWTTSAITDTSTAVGHTYLDTFTELDAEGYPAHPNAPDITQVNTTAATTNVLDDDLIDDDQAQSDFWICIPPEGAYLFEANPTSEAVGVYMSEVCGSDQMEQKLDGTYTNTGTNPLGYFEGGYYRVRLYHHDITANGIARLLYENAAGNNATIPTSWLSQKRPVAKPIRAWCCSDGKIWSKDRSEELFLSEKLLDYDPRCSGGSCPKPESGNGSDSCSVINTVAATQGGNNGLSINGAGTTNHGIKIENVPANVAQTINDCISAGNILRIVVSRNGEQIGIFAAENVTGTALAGETFALFGDAVTNTCDIASQGIDGDGNWNEISVTCIQS